MYGVTFVFMTPAHFVSISQNKLDFLSNLKCLMLGGESLSYAALEKALNNARPKHIYHCYGPAENTIISTIYEVNDFNGKEGNIPIGLPINGVELYLVDNDFNEVPDGDRGNIILSGIGLTNKYLNNDKQSQERYIHHNGKIFYKTGDIGWKNKENIFMFSCREDSQIKYNGNLIVLNEIEEYLKSNFSINYCYVYFHNIDNKRLIFFVYPKKENKSNLQDNIYSWINTRFNRKLSVEIEMLFNEIPLTKNKKVDKEKILTNFFNKNKTHKLENNFDIKDDKIIKILRLVTKKNNIDFESNITELGLDSLNIIELILLIEKEFNRVLTADMIFNCYSIKELSELIFNKEIEDISVNKLKKDLVLTPDINANHYREFNPEKEDRSVFLTGVTGLLGVFLLSDLLLDDTIDKIYCLVRCDDPISGYQRIKENLALHHLLHDNGSVQYLDKIVVLSGDLSKPFMGLSQEQYIEIASLICSIYHSAAYVNHLQSYDYHFKANVVGIYNILKFAKESRLKEIHHISTLDTLGILSPEEKDKKIIENFDLLKNLNYLSGHNGYAQSKWVCEILLEQARERNFKISIYRPGFILGNMNKGSGNSIDLINKIMIGSLLVGCYPQFEPSDFNFISANNMSKSVVFISKNQKEYINYNIIPDKNENTVYLQSFFKILERMKPDFKPVSVEKWSLLINTQDNPAKSLLYFFDKNNENFSLFLNNKFNNIQYCHQNAVNVLNPEISDLLQPLAKSFLLVYCRYWISESQKIQDKS